jgi:hypothetical protein
MSNSKTRHKQMWRAVSRKAASYGPVLAIAVLGMLLPGTIRAAGAGTLQQESAQETKPAPAANPAAAQPRPAPSAVELETWRQTILHTKRPKKTCYTATYPEKAWTEVTCIKPPNVRMSTASAPKPFTVGNNADDSAQVASGSISRSDGLFASATGVTSECGQQCTLQGLIIPGSCAANSFSLQLNTNNMVGSVVCNGAVGDCHVEEQFVFSNSQCAASEPELHSKACIFIQYWVHDFGANDSGCPTTAPWQNTGAGCLMNSANAASVPQQLVTGEELKSLKLTGVIEPGVPRVKLADVNGEVTYDTVVLTIGPTVYTAPGDNALPDLYKFWSSSEFNIFGDSCRAQAVFNKGTTLQVQTTVESGTASPPTCSGLGNTLETNNLNLLTNPLDPAAACSRFGGASPGIMFGEGLPNGHAGTTALFYSPDAGEADILGVNSSGNQTLYFPNPSLSTTWNEIVTGDFSGGGQQALFYDRAAGVAEVIAFDSQGKISRDTPNKGFRTTWGKILAGDFNGNEEGRQQAAFYDHSAGEIDIVEFDTKGGEMHTTPNPSIGANWDKLVAGDFMGSPPQILLYDRTAGKAEVMQFDKTGHVLKPPVVHSHFRTTWDRIVVGDFTANENGRQQSLFYDRTAGQIDVVAFNPQGDEILDAQNPGIGTTWDIVEAGDFLGNGRQQVFLYDRAAGHAEVLQFDKNGKAIPNPIVITTFRTTWDKAVVGNFMGASKSQQQVLLYDENAGEVDVVSFKKNGGENLDGQNSGYRGARDIIVAGDFVP